MSTTVIGAKPPEYSRIWRNLADRPQFRKIRYAGSAGACNGGIVSAVPQNNPVGQYHFRTPSPGGQQVFPNTLLPTFFSGMPRRSFTVRRQRRAVLCSFRQDRAHFGRAVSERLTLCEVEVSRPHTSKGKKSWLSNQLFSRLLQHLALPPVVTRLQSARSSVVQSAQAPVQSQAAASLAVLQSVLRATCLPASWTSSTADPLTPHASSNQTFCERRRASLRGGVLRITSNSSEAPCSKSF